MSSQRAAEAERYGGGYNFRTDQMCILAHLKAALESPNNAQPDEFVSNEKKTLEFPCQQLLIFSLRPVGRYYHASLRCPNGTGFHFKMGHKVPLSGCYWLLGVVTGGLFARFGTLPARSLRERCGSLVYDNGERGNCCSASDFCQNCQQLCVKPQVIYILSVV